MKNDIITHHRTLDPLLCPVKIWSRIIKWIISYPATTPESTVNTFLNQNGWLHHFSCLELLSRLRKAAQSLGPDILGFNYKQIGLHSARSGAAMAMYLAGVPVFTIMLLGRWSSDAFLWYIREQVQGFSLGISSKMIQNEEFFTVPSASFGGPTSSNHSSNKASQNTNGFSFQDAIRPLIRAFHWIFSITLSITLHDPL